jgi:tetratricopeptide (TPR) repeat protein
MVSADGFQLWSQRFDAEAVPSTFFDVQEQFASALVNRVRPRQSIIRNGEASAGSIVLSLHPSLLKAEVWLEEGNESEVQCALAKFHEIAQAAKGYARPIYGVAQCYCWMTLCGAPPSAGMVSLARSAAEQAVELDPESSEALATKGSILALEWDWTGAEEAFRQAAKLGFYASDARQFAMFRTLLGRFDDAWPYLDKAQLTDPFSHLQKVACAKFLYMSGRHQEAFEVFSEPLKYGPLPLEVQLYLALIHANLGQFDQARRLAQLILRNAGSQIPLRAGATEILARCGDDAAPMAHEHKLLSSGAPLSRYRQALLSIALGDSEGALSLLSSALEGKEAELPWLAVDPRFVPIRLNARFAEIVSKVRP